MRLREEIRSYIVLSGCTIKEVVQRVNQKYDRNYSVQNLTNKIYKETLRYREAKEIAEAIGYEIKWEPKEKD